VAENPKRQPIARRSLERWHRVGLTEAEARRRGLRVRVAHLPAAVPQAVTSGETRCHLKAVVDIDTDRVVFGRLE
jgi:pyruvate/2-oxoglutarate dehydrogenase complex dihydrolipoamide dehydrogenase (E3) component